MHPGQFVFRVRSRPHRRQYLRHRRSRYRSACKNDLAGAVSRAGGGAQGPRRPRHGMSPLLVLLGRRHQLRLRARVQKEHGDLAAHQAPAALRPAPHGLRGPAHRQLQAVPPAAAAGPLPHPRALAVTRGDARPRDAQLLTSPRPPCGNAGWFSNALKPGLQLLFRRKRKLLGKKLPRGGIRFSRRCVPRPTGASQCPRKREVGILSCKIWKLKP